MTSSIRAETKNTKHQGGEKSRENFYFLAEVREERTSCIFSYRIKRPKRLHLHLKTLPGKKGKERWGRDATVEGGRTEEKRRRNSD